MEGTTEMSEMLGPEPRPEPSATVLCYEVKLLALLLYCLKVCRFSVCLASEVLSWLVTVMPPSISLDECASVFLCVCVLILEKLLIGPVEVLLLVLVEPTPVLLFLC